MPTTHNPHAHGLAQIDDFTSLRKFPRPTPFSPSACCSPLALCAHCSAPAPTTADTCIPDHTTPYRQDERRGKRALLLLPFWRRGGGFVVVMDSYPQEPAVVPAGRPPLPRHPSPPAPIPPPPSIPSATAMAMAARAVCAPSCPPSHSRRLASTSTIPHVIGGDIQAVRLACPTQPPGVEAACWSFAPVLGGWARPHATPCA